MADQLINVRLLSDDRVLQVKFPTDQQWIERHRARRILQQDLGQGSSQTKVVDNDDFDGKLLAQLAGGENSFSPGDATLVLNRLSEGAVEDLEHEGATFVVTLRTAFGQIKVTTGKPTGKQLLDYRRNFVRSIDLPHGKVELKTNLAAAGDLFDAISPGSTLSIVHKVPIVAAVIAEVDRLLQPANESFTTGS